MIYGRLSVLCQSANKVPNTILTNQLPETLPMSELPLTQTAVPPVMNVEEVADYLRVAPATIYRLAQQGKIPGAKVGRSWRFSKDRIDRWLDEQSKLAERGVVAE